MKEILGKGTSSFICSSHSPPHYHTDFSEIMVASIFWKSKVCNTIAFKGAQGRKDFLNLQSFLSYSLQNVNI